MGTETRAETGRRRAGHASAVGRVGRPRSARPTQLSYGLTGSFLAPGRRQQRHTTVPGHADQ